MLVGRLPLSCLKLPNEHVVDDGLLFVAQTAMVGEQAFDVGAGVAAYELAIPKR
jgi:hypothetical protein